MAVAEYITQPPGVGRERGLKAERAEHIICLLRAIEHLPRLTEPVLLCSYTEDELRRCIAELHKNHLELSQCASLALCDKE